MVRQCKELCYFIETITHSSLGHINIKLCRPYCFAFCTGQVLLAKSEYGSWPAMGDQLYLYSHDLSTCNDEVIAAVGQEGYCAELHKLLNYPVTKARGVLLTSLLCKLLLAAGFTVTTCNIADSHSDDDEMLFKSLFTSPQVLPYITKQPIVAGDCVEVGNYLSERSLVG